MFHWGKISRQFVVFLLNHTCLSNQWRSDYCFYSLTLTMYYVAVPNKITGQLAHARQCQILLSFGAWRVFILDPAYSKRDVFCNHCILYYCKAVFIHHKYLVIFDIVNKHCIISQSIVKAAESEQTPNKSLLISLKIEAKMLILLGGICDALFWSQWPMFKPSVTPDFFFIFCYYLLATHLITFYYDSQTMFLFKIFESKFDFNLILTV